MTDPQEGAKIFIWGQVGKQLQSLDKDRMLSIIQADHEIHLARLANLELLTASKSFMDLDSPSQADLERYRKAVNNTNDRDNIFRQTAQLLKDSQDMLSIGSAMTGELERKHGYLKIRYGGD